MKITKKNYNVLADCREMYEDEIIETVLKNRGIKDVEHFLNPTEKDLEDTNLFGLQDTIGYFRWILEENKNVGVIFDVDTDGVCAGTILTRYLQRWGVEPKTFINKGKSHGLIGQDLERFEGIDLLFIVDSLDSDISRYKELRERGTRIIVLDHHAIDKNIPYDNYVLLISSQRAYQNPQLSGAGVVWKFCKYIDECFDTNYADDYADLAACGILADVCDVSEDSKENRYIISKGLDNLNNMGLKNIIGSYEFNSKSVLFSVAPLINASCRVSKNEVAMQMFLSDDIKEVRAYKKELEECKNIQNEEVEEILPNVWEDFDKQGNSKVLYTVIDTDYGVAGLIGNKCLDLYNKPMFILKDNGNEYCGSMRSVGYGDFRTLCNETGLAVLNGHEEASGIVVEKDSLEEFISVVNEKLSTMEQTTSADIQVDCEVDLADITSLLVKKVKQINRISGNGFKPITFKVSNIYDYAISHFKEGKHLVIYPCERDNIQMIEWNTKADYGILEDASLMNVPIEVVGELEDGFFCRKYTIKLIISDLRVN